MWEVHFYANQQKGILPNIQTVAAYKVLSADHKGKVREVLWQHPDLIDDFVHKNPANLAEDELAILRHWRDFFVQGRFYIFRHLKKGSIFMGGGRVYSVIGIQTELEEVVPSYALPYLVNAVLLPFKGQITYDGLLPGYNITFGGGIRGDLNHQYTVAKQKERIITTLEPGAAAAKPSVPKGSKDLLPRLEHLSAETAKLKGETTLQTTAITLARASLEIALASLKEEDLEAPARSLRRAHTRLSNLLDIEQGY
jgi:hypothetical protein